MPLRLALSLHAADEALRSRADARERALSARRRARGVPRVLRAQAPARVRRVRDARGRQRPLRAGARAGAGADGRLARAAADLQGQPDPLQPDRTRRVYARAPAASRSPRSARRWSRAACRSRCASRAGATSTPPAASSPLGRGASARSTLRSPCSRQALLVSEPRGHERCSPRARLAGAQQALAQLGLLLRGGVPAARCRAARRGCAARTASGTACVVR